MVFVLSCLFSILLMAVSRTLCDPNDVVYNCDVSKIVKARDFGQYLLDSTSADHVVSFESGYKDACTWVCVYVVNRPIQDEHNIDGEQQSGLHTFLPLASFQLQICNFHFYRKFYQAIPVQDASSRHPVAHVQDRRSRHNIRGQRRRELSILVFN